MSYDISKLKGFMVFKLEIYMIYTIFSSVIILILSLIIYYKIRNRTSDIIRSGPPKLRFRKRDKMLFYGKRILRKMKNMKNDQFGHSNIMKKYIIFKVVRSLLSLKRDSEGKPILKSKQPPPSALLEDDLLRTHIRGENYLPDEVIFMLKSIQVFGHFEKPVFLELCKHFEPVNLMKDEFLFKETDADQNMYVVLKGRIDVSVIEKDNSRMTTKKACEGDTIYSLLSVLDNLHDKSPVFERVCAKAHKDSLVLKLPVKALKDIFQKYPQSLVRLVQIIMVRLQRVTFLALNNHLGLTSELLNPDYLQPFHYANNENPQNLHVLHLFGGPTPGNLPPYEVVEGITISNLQGTNPNMTKTSSGLSRVSNTIPSKLSDLKTKPLGKPPPVLPYSASQRLAALYKFATKKLGVIKRARTFNTLPSAQTTTEMIKDKTNDTTNINVVNNKKLDVKPDSSKNLEQDNAPTFKLAIHSRDDMFPVLAPKRSNLMEIKDGNLSQILTQDLALSNSSTTADSPNLSSSTVTTLNPNKPLKDSFDNLKQDDMANNGGVTSRKKRLARMGQPRTATCSLDRDFSRTSCKDNIPTHMDLTALARRTKYNIITPNNCHGEENGQEIRNTDPMSTNTTLMTPNNTLLSDTTLGNTTNQTSIEPTSPMLDTTSITLEDDNIDDSITTSVATNTTSPSSVPRKQKVSDFDMAVSRCMNNRRVSALGTSFGSYLSSLTSGCSSGVNNNASDMSSKPRTTNDIVGQRKKKQNPILFNRRRHHCQMKAGVAPRTNDDMNDRNGTTIINDENEFGDGNDVVNSTRDDKDGSSLDNINNRQRSRSKSTPNISDVEKEVLDAAALDIKAMLNLEMPLETLKTKLNVTVVEANTVLIEQDSLDVCLIFVASGLLSAWQKDPISLQTKQQHHQMYENMSNEEIPNNARRRSYYTNAGQYNRNIRRQRGQTSIGGRSSHKMSNSFSSKLHSNNIKGESNMSSFDADKNEHNNKFSLDEVCVFVVKPGEFVDALSVITGEASIFTIKARTRSWIVYINKPQFYEILNEQPWAVLNLAHTVVAKISPFLRQIDYSLDWVQLEAGRALYRQNEISDCIYIVLSGRLRSIHKLHQHSHKREIIGEYGRGELVGLVEVLSLKPRFSTLFAIRDTELAKIPDGLLDLIQRNHPKVVTRLIHLLSERLLVMQTWARPVFEFPGYESKPITSNFSTIALVPANLSVPISNFTCELQFALNSIVPTLKLDSFIIKSELGENSLDSYNEYRLSNWLAQQEDMHGMVLYQCDYHLTNWTRRCVRQADCVLIVTLAEMGPLPGHLEVQLENFMVRAQRELIILHRDRSVPPRATADWINSRSWISSHHHVVCPKRLFLNTKRLFPSYYHNGNSNRAYGRPSLASQSTYTDDNNEEPIIKPPRSPYGNGHLRNNSVQVQNFGGVNNYQTWTSNPKNGKRQSVFDPRFFEDKNAIFPGQRFDYDGDFYMDLLYHASNFNPEKLKDKTEDEIKALIIKRNIEFCDNDFYRLARFLTGSSIGLVLGGGGARGAAHVGMIKAMKECGIPIDLIGGTSIGAFMGALYAEDRDVVDMTRRARDWSNNMTSIWKKVTDLTYPYTAMFTGSAFNNSIEQVFKDKMIEDLWIPYFNVTTDISSYDMKIHTSGCLWRYVRASMSLSGYLPPLCDPSDGHLLLDGGYCNNLPADVAKKMGCKIIIAVDVGSKNRDDFTNYGDELSGWWLLWKKYFFPWGIPVKVPDLNEVQMRLAYVSGNKTMQDIKQNKMCEYFRPPIDAYKTLQFASFDEISQTGYKYGKEAFEEWKQNINYDELFIHDKDNKHPYAMINLSPTFTDLVEMISKIKKPQNVKSSHFSPSQNLYHDFDDMMDNQNDTLRFFPKEDNSDNDNSLSNLSTSSYPEECAHLSNQLGLELENEIDRDVSEEHHQHHGSLLHSHIDKPRIGSLHPKSSTLNNGLTFGGGTKEKNRKSLEIPSSYSALMNDVNHFGSIDESDEPLEEEDAKVVDNIVNHFIQTEQDKLERYLRPSASQYQQSSNANIKTAIETQSNIETVTAKNMDPDVGLVFPASEPSIKSDKDTICNPADKESKQLNDNQMINKKFGNIYHNQYNVRPQLYKDANKVMSQFLNKRKRTLSA